MKLQWSPEAKSYGTMLADAIGKGMAPFRLKRVYMYNDFDIDCNEYRVIGEAVLLDGFVFGFSERVNAWDLAGQPEAEMRRVIDKMFWAFRNRAAWMVPPNVTLGEN